MIWLNASKVSNKIDALVKQLEVLGERISYHEKQFELAKKMALAEAGENEQIQMLRRMQVQLVGNLPSLHSKIRSGEEDYREVNRALPVVKEQIEFLRSALDSADRSESIGRDAARRNLGV